MITRLSYRNLFHDRVRLGVTLAGVVFAIVLVVVQLGLFLGFMAITSSVIDHSDADLWIAAPGVRNFDVGTPLPESRRWLALGVEGVRSVTPYIVRFAGWKLPSGAEENVEIIGFDPDTGSGGPWNLVEGEVSDLKAPNVVIIDEFYKDRLQVKSVGDTTEIRGRRARVVGFTRGIRSFTTSPQVFTWHKNALDYTGMPAGQSIYLLVRTAPGADAAQVQRALRKRLPDLEVMSGREFSRRTRAYWLLSTGAGVTILLAAALGLLVGLVVVTQTIYATTLDHIREYGTLMAIGASRTYLWRVILEQAAIAAVLGYVLAMAIAAPIASYSRDTSTLILLPWQLAAGTFFAALAMCMGASLVSIRRAGRLDPAMVFKG